MIPGERAYVSFPSFFLGQRCDGRSLRSTLGHEATVGMETACEEWKKTMTEGPWVPSDCGATVPNLGCFPLDFSRVYRNSPLHISVILGFLVYAAESNPY